MPVVNSPINPSKKVPAKHISAIEDARQGAEARVAEGSARKFKLVAIQDYPIFRSIVWNQTPTTVAFGSAVSVFLWLLPFLFEGSFWRMPRLAIEVAKLQLLQNDIIKTGTGPEGTIEFA